MSAEKMNLYKALVHYKLIDVLIIIFSVGLLILS